MTSKANMYWFFKVPADQFHESPATFLEITEADIEETSADLWLRQEADELAKIPSSLRVERLMTAVRDTFDRSPNERDAKMQRERERITQLYRMIEHHLNKASEKYDASLSLPVKKKLTLEEHIWSQVSE